MNELSVSVNVPAGPVPSMSSQPEAPAKVTARGLNFYYGEHHALKNINLTLGTHRVTAFIGPSGCGKSTLLRIFNRMYDLYPGQRATGQLMLDQTNVLDPKLDLNLLRARVGMPALNNAFVTSNGLDMLTEIRRERTVELAFEGFRRDDLRRWKTAEQDMPQAIKGVKFVGTEYQHRDSTLKVGTDIQVDANGFVVAEAAGSRQFLPKHYLDPIPLQQIQLSHGTLLQNPGW